MISIRDVFRTRYGKVEELLELFRRFRLLAPELEPRPAVRLTSDVVGPLFSVATEFFLESIDEFYGQTRGLWKQFEFQVWFNQMTNVVEHGTREFYNIQVPLAKPEGEPGHLMVRNVFHTRYGRADAMVDHLKREAALAEEYNIPPLAIYTDMSGPMFTVVSVRDYESLAAYERALQTIRSTPEYSEWRRGLLVLVEEGRREVWQIE